MTSREVAQAARRFADQQSDRFAGLPTARLLRATVDTVTAGAASDGRALVTVAWRGASLTIADYPDTYTPGIGHRVLCALVDNQLSILHNGVGSP